MGKPEDFARLARDPFEGILDDIPYPNKDGTNSVSDMSFEDEVGKVNPKTKLPSHESFIECGNAVCRKKLRGGRWCLIRINIDNMKILCERYGDRAGDTTVQKNGIKHSLSSQKAYSSLVIFSYMARRFRNNCPMC